MPRIGEVIAGKYRLDKVAGEGGMGIVYAAEHLVLKQRVAVKVLLPEAATSEAQVERFAREARAAAKLNSEFVARVLDAGSLASGAPFLVMEYLEGCDLEELLDLQKTLPVPEVVDYLLQALEGLAHAHAVNIVHRDLKPANLFLACRPDGSNAIKLLDFGISKATTSRPEDKRLTGQHVLGSPVYMSPEQLRNSPDIDARADMWSIGIVGYELLTGAPPFDGDDVGEIFAAILETTPIPLTEKNPKIPKELSDIFLKCLRRDREERWQDAGQVARALAPFGSDPESPVVERTEQVLARAKRLSTNKTPIEARLVVEAIEAAAKRAMTTAGKTSPVLPLSRVKRAGLGPRLALFARRSPVRAGAAALALVALLGGSALALTRRAAAPGGPTEAPGQGRTVRRAESETTRDPGESESESESAPLLMDLPPDTPRALPPSSNGERASRVRPKSAPSNKPQRPKFLNTRE